MRKWRGLVRYLYLFLAFFKIKNKNVKNKKQSRGFIINGRIFKFSQILRD